MTSEIIKKPDSHEEIFIKPIEIRLELFCRHILTFGCVARVIVDVGKEDGL